MATEDNRSKKNPDQDFGLPKTNFEPIRRGSNGRWPTIGIIISIALIIGAGTTYWFWAYSPLKMSNIADNNAKETFRDNGLNELQGPDKTINDFVEDTPNNEGTDTDGVGTDNLAHEESSQLIKTAEPGVITHINTPQGLYYVIVASFIDIDLAIDYAKQLVKQGATVKIIKPRQGEHFLQVAIDQAASLGEARRKVQQLTSLYDVQTWVMKY